MRLRCSCGRPVEYRSYYVTCLECGKACCSSCTFIFESATYCVACTESILGVAGVARSARGTSLDDATFGAAVIRG
jgi:hypothetical protein